ncbi:MAG TPA: ammonium transporter [Planctomycetaceae bacterium]|nr:ammonium transporter [Planctomycetaceae bacterium]
MNPYRVLLSMFVGALLIAGPLGIERSWGQEPESPSATESAPEGESATEAESEAPAVPEYYEKKELDYTINTLIMFICAVLVIFMQAGFAMVESGFNASKNTVNILAKNLMDLAIGIPLYLFIGFGLMYPGEAGAGKWFHWAGFGPFDRGTTDVVSELGNYSSSADFLFQVAFAATAATIVSGAVAGRMKFGGYLIYSAILTGLIYPISGMWKWGGGALAAMNFQDFAGSVVVHAVGGFAGLAGALVLGPRIGRYSADGKSQPMLGHSIPLAALGVFILLVGWYGFNPGSQLTYSGAANAEATSYIAVTTTLSAATGAVFALGLAWIMFGKPDLSMALNGMLAGLVGITANCDRVSQEEALIIGAISGVIVVLAIIALDKMKIDDPVGAFPVHGVCGVWGGIATGIFGNLPTDEMTRAGFIMVQVKSTAIICVWAFLTMFILFFILKQIGLLRVSAEEEIAGLDLHEHGMPAYTH